MFVVIPAGFRQRLSIIALIFALQSVFGENECPIPSIPNGNFKVVEPGYESGKPIPDSGVIKFSCDEGYSIFPSDDDTVYCRSGSYNNTLPQCLVSECGELKSEGLGLIDNGTLPERKSFPWHVGFYRKQPNTENYEYLCAGSIISATKVVSVAHCFYINEKRASTDEYYIAAGKHYSDYNAVEDTLNGVQKRKVSHLAILPNYTGLSTKYQADLSVATVEEPFILSQSVRPVCIDWQSLYEDEQLKSNNLGQIVELYTSEIGGNMPFKRISVPYVDRSQCLTSVPQNFVSHVTADKLCAGYTDGTSIGGLSGAGIVFEKKQSSGTTFFLRGILNTGPVKNGQRDLSSYAAYIKVSTYLKFIQAAN